MATHACDSGVAVDLENGGGGCGGHDGPVPGVQSRASAVSGHAVPTTVVTLLLLYYFFFMFYVIGFSKTWWHAVLGIVVSSAFSALSDILDSATPQELKQLKIKDDSRQCLKLMTLVSFYVFFLFYLVGSSEYWWHVALGIVLVTGFVMLSYMMQDLLPGIDVKPPDSDGSNLSTALLGSSA